MNRTPISWAIKINLISESTIAVIVNDSSNQNGIKYTIASEQLAHFNNLEFKFEIALNALMVTAMATKYSVML